MKNFLDFFFGNHNFNLHKDSFIIFHLMVFCTRNATFIYGGFLLVHEKLWVLQKLTWNWRQTLREIDEFPWIIKPQIMNPLQNCSLKDGSTNVFFVEASFSLYYHLWINLPVPIFLVPHAPHVIITNYYYVQFQNLNYFFI